jgi:ATP-binding cassette subfamily B protein
VGLLLGWHRPSSGRILVDGVPLRGERLQTLRRETAWVDPAVRLWNRSLLDNLYYGTRDPDGTPLDLAMEQADLFEILERLPQGLQTSLGEGGGLVSGGEGQRVRLGRAILRPGVRLVILDEPFRGLDRPRRRELLSNARQHWQQATLICVTHDVGETQGFQRVLVIEEGQIVQDAPPGVLAARPGSRYRALLEAEKAVRTGLWEGAVWRRLWLQDGRLREEHPGSDGRLEDTGDPARQTRR